MLYALFPCIILSVLFRITDVAYKVFFDAIETQGRALLRVPLVRLASLAFLIQRLSRALISSQDLDDISVNPPLSILDHAQILREIMTVYESSLLGDEDPAERNAGFKRILDVMVQPAIEMCSAASEEKQRLRVRWDKHVFVLNCLTYMQVGFISSESYPLANLFSEYLGAFLIYV